MGWVTIKLIKGLDKEDTFPLALDTSKPSGRQQTSQGGIKEDEKEEKRGDVPPDQDDP